MMPSDYFYHGPSKLISLLVIAFFCCCWLPHSVEGSPTNWNVPSRMHTFRDATTGSAVKVSALKIARAILATPNNASVPDYSYLGCFTDSQPRSLVLPSGTSRYLLNGISYVSPDDMTWGSCALFCSNYAYAGISAGSTCRCGNSFTFPQVRSLDALCQVPCAGNSIQSCGGNAQSIVFFNKNFGNNVLPSPSSSLPIATPSLPIVVPPSFSSRLLFPPFPSNTPPDDLLPVIVPAVSSSTTTQIMTLTPSPLGELASNSVVPSPFVLVGSSSTQVLEPVIPVLLQSPVSGQPLIPEAPTILVPSQILPGLQGADLLSQIAASATNPVLNAQPTPIGSILQTQFDALPTVPGILSPTPSVPEISSVTGVPSAGLASLQPAALPAEIPSNNFGLGSLNGESLPVSTSFLAPLTSIGSLSEDAAAVLENTTPFFAAAPLFDSVLPFETPSLAVFPIPSPLSVPQLENSPLTPAAALSPPDIPILSTQPIDDESFLSATQPETPWWVITDFLEPHGLPDPTSFATPPPVAVPVLPVEEDTGFPAPLIPAPLFEAPLVTAPISTASTEPPVLKIIDSGTVLDKIFTWTFYSDGTAQVDAAYLSPVVGPIQSYLPDGTRIGMDSAGLYIGWNHRIPYPPVFSQIIQGYLLPPPQSFR